MEAWNDVEYWLGFDGIWIWILIEIVVGPYNLKKEWQVTRHVFSAVRKAEQHPHGLATDVTWSEAIYAQGLGRCSVFRRFWWIPKLNANQRGTPGFASPSLDHSLAKPQLLAWLYSGCEVCRTVFSVAWWKWCCAQKLLIGRLCSEKLQPQKIGRGWLLQN